MRIAIWWVRRDLRLADNQALQAALAAAEIVIPLFVIDPVLLAAEDVAPRRVAFLWAGLRALDEALRARHSRLVVRYGAPPAQVASVATAAEAEAVFAEEDWWPYAVARDRKVAELVRLVLCPGLTVHPPATITTADARPYTVFTPFRRAWLARPFPAQATVAPPAYLHAAHCADVAANILSTLDSVPLPEPPVSWDEAAFPAGEGEARRRLEAFASSLSQHESDTAQGARIRPLAGRTGRDSTTRNSVGQPGSPPLPIYRYAALRDRLDVDGTSRLSPYLRFGMLSARSAAQAAWQAAGTAEDEQLRASALAWLSELIWREFYQYVLFWFPHVLRGPFRDDLADVPWSDDGSAFDRWSAGQTGYPVVDAAMRALNATGWLHNRGRMIVASFLAKDLLIHWREGERYFMQQLLDGDPAANNGGWQWSAGTGTDAAPYFRIFNPVLQGQRFDPDGAYVRRWVPELELVPTAYVHAPWRMPERLQRQVGCVIGRDYPLPCVDHAVARERALAAFRSLRRKVRTPKEPKDEDA